MPVEQVVVSHASSHEHGCTYAVAAHSVLASEASAMDPSVTDASRDDSAVPEPAFAALSPVSRPLVTTRGRPSTMAPSRFLAAGDTAPSSTVCCWRSR